MSIFVMESEKIHIGVYFRCGICKKFSFMIWRIAWRMMPRREPKQLYLTIVEPQNKHDSYLWGIEYTYTVKVNMHPKAMQMGPNQQCLAHWVFNIT